MLNLQSRRRRRAPACVVLSVVVAACTQEFDPALLDTGPGAVALTGRRCGGSAGRCADGAVCFEGRCVSERRVQSLGMSAAHSCAADGLQTLWCWGLRPEDNRLPARLVPEVIAAGEWNQVSAAGAEDRIHSCAIHAAGSLWCWGSNGQGQLGLGLDVANTKSPELVSGGTWTWVAAAEGVTCAVRDEGSLWCWGSAAWLPTDTQGKPRQIGTELGYTAVSVGARHACALREGTLYCWGRNDVGQLGNGAIEPQALYLLPVAVAGDGWSTIAAGLAHQCAIAADRSLWCWGDGSSGQLGFEPPGGSAPEPVQVSPGTTWLHVSAGARHTCAIRSDASLWCWGSSEFGQSGRSEGARSSEPRRVSAEVGWSKVACGAEHSCAIAQNGSLWCWGAGSFGQLGLGTTENRDTPEQVALKTP